MQSIFELEKEEDLYSILGCVDSSSPEQIKTEYKSLALLYHPDKNSSKSNEFKKIQSAYNILGNPSTRAQYDRWKASGIIIPFSDFIQLGAHTQSVHWQALPSQLVLTDSNSNNKGDMVEGIRSAPSIVSQLPRVKIESTDGFWKTKKNYVINDRST
ncbi:hypothetical protein G6F46_008003 [Rhizopus delemar]|uniref:J domain-containing protein n=2 Tax=Rhizopus TaxID=4842 RepID=A0A9P7CMI8_9FUNG|nr:hypothetical protein G6F43_010909 [Rhizopus delemar]KAG1549630.1 hypothetical protein G6F51_002947 [Rhizopus arrhizus]KAG1455773.1 hypothetical protein G6F55_006880 [Rhizopus delemar]KAG1502473.1 hypothetical protein G6F54_002343 [Rhizopus delemar]KAG1508988.1 hypothetical protein G6F53_007782 [Rhizopus delemar]